MGNVSIIYSGNGIILEPADRWERRNTRRAGSHTSDAGITETVRLGIWDEVFVEVLFTSSDSYRKLEGWWAWASQGKQYTIQLDDARSCNTTLVNNEAIGATTIEVASGAAVIDLPRYFLMQSADLTKREKVIVTNNGGGGSLTINPGTIYAYSAGDIFKEPEFFAKAVTIDDAFPVIENPGMTYTFSHRFREDRG